MKPGRELDILIAEKVFGFVVESQEEYLPSWDTPPIKFTEYYALGLGCVPDYSTNILYAWKVVEKKDNFHFVCIREMEFRNDGKNPPDQMPEDTGMNTYYVWKYSACFGTMFVDGKFVGVSYESMAHAICLGALKLAEAG